MENRMTVVQALQERELLAKKIALKLEKTRFVDYGRTGMAAANSHMGKAEFASEAERALQQLEALIVRYDALNAAILEANGAAVLETSRGRMTVACALGLRRRLRGSAVGGSRTDFEGQLAQHLEEQYADARAQLYRRNEALVLGDAGEQAAAGSGREKLYRLYDPLRAKRRAEALSERREALLIELDTKIKLSNAATCVTLEKELFEYGYQDCEGVTIEERKAERM